MPKELSERIEMLMAKRRVSYRQLEKLTGITTSMLNRYIKQQRDIPTGRVEIIAKALGTTPFYLLYGYKNEADKIRQESNKKAWEEIMSSSHAVSIEEETLNELNMYVLANDFTVDEIKDLMNYAKFLVSKR